MQKDIAQSYTSAPSRHRYPAQKSVPESPKLTNSKDGQQTNRSRATSIDLNHGRTYKQKLRSVKSRIDCWNRSASANGAVSRSLADMTPLHKTFDKRVTDKSIEKSQEVRKFELHTVDANQNTDLIAQCSFFAEQKPIAKVSAEKPPSYLAPTAQSRNKSILSSEARASLDRTSAKKDQMASSALKTPVKQTSQENSFAMSIL